ncbi:MAG: hypothetical protein LHW45_00205 [Candidatus Cloacimonetes bacterium]|nr:hypothetical protein [Candidatus Cloacimonadota bacterium]MDY0366041.1 hypothetical protein [Candidatus Syntrophosphaera sp.]
MKIAIHDRKNSYSERWIKYCEEKRIPYILVNCYDSDILEQVKDCQGLMWNWSHNDYRDQNFARQLSFSVGRMGIKMFPDYNTCWHFDDKVGQKYLLESIGAPLIPSFVFYNKRDALRWVSNNEFPKVFKLRGGAGSANVKLVKSAAQARAMVNRAFGRGFPSVDRYSTLQQRLWVLRRDKNLKAAMYLMKGLAKVIKPPRCLGMLPRHRGYVYFQDFIPGNNYDQRVLVIGNRAVSHRRYIRKNDFRASGSGLVHIDKEPGDIEAVRIAFEVSNVLSTQCLAFDFLHDQECSPLIVEISYASPLTVYDLTPGYWNVNLEWVEAEVNPQYFIIEDFISSIQSQLKKAD